ncbi:MAG: YhbY family RNA-binding protein [Gammaproteobacteria bacterium]|nr:YhbY family RNA-binding protein [Gammaproteobacteria bacterium]
MTLSNADKKTFRAIGHQLKPVITVAEKGLTENIQLELERALNDHELIKLKLIAGDKAERTALVDEICSLSKGIAVQTIGHVLLLYRAAKKPDPKLSNLLRFAR